MADASFGSRLAELESMAHAKALQSPAPTFPKARNHSEKLAIALAHLEHGGVTGAYAYPPVFETCACMGIFMKPLHYRSWIGLVAFFLATATLLATFTLVAGVALGTMPRPVRAMIDEGPLVFFGGSFVLGVIFAAIHKAKAAQIGLPRWRDI